MNCLCEMTGSKFTTICVAHQALCDGDTAKLELQYRELIEWAKEKGRGHRELAIKRQDEGDDEMVSQHIALESAYFSLAEELDNRQQTEKPKDLGLDVATYEAAKREQAEGRRIPLDKVIDDLTQKEKRKDAGCPGCGLGVTGKDALCDKHYSEYLGQNRARGNNEND